MEMSCSTMPSSFARRSSARSTRTGLHTAILGSSLGGVAALHAAWQWPKVFGMAACLSGTIGWKDDLRERIASERKRSLRLYLDSGWPADNYEVTREMASLLTARGFEEGKEMLYLAFPHALHNERSWAMRVHLRLQFFFGRLPGLRQRSHSRLS